MNILFNKILLNNYFLLFKIPEQFTVNACDLDSNYNNLQLKFHPDLFTQNNSEKDLAIQSSAYINEAYKILKDPLSRAKYILNLRNIKIDFSLNSIKIKNTFLNKNMNLYIYIEEESQKKNINSLKNILKKIHLKKIKYFEKLSILLDNNKNLSAKKIIIKLIFINRIILEVNFQIEKIINEQDKFNAKNIL